MILKTFQFIQGKGWSIEKFPDLDSESTLVLIFAAPEFINNEAPILELAKAFPNSKIMGCSSAGEITGAFINDHSLSVAIAKFEKTPLKIATTTIESPEQSFEAGKNISRDLNSENLSGIFVLSEGLQINGSDLVRGLNSINKNYITITGGLAGDGNRFKETWIIDRDKILTKKVIAVGFYGDAIHIGHGSKGGWDIFGPERCITRSHNNILYELDGRPALQLYKEYLGEKAAGLPATGLLFPLAIRKTPGDHKQLVRTILGINEQEESLIFAGDIPTGYYAQLMRANFDRLITGAIDAGKAALLKNKKLTSLSKSTLLIAISCVGRRLLLGERTEEETESVLELFPSGTEQVGFYSYGELSPYSKGDCSLHNQTMTLTSITEI